MKCSSGQAQHNTDLRRTPENSITPHEHRGICIKRTRHWRHTHEGTKHTRGDVRKAGR